jgi:hypothetical protein
MNIFKALSEGHGQISETNITSFVSYLLNSSNELKNSFFVLFAELIDTQLNENKICDLLNIKQKFTRDKIIHFSNSYIVSSVPEHRIQKDDKQLIIPDILVRIFSKDKEEIKAFFLIENKIKKGSLTPGQLEKQVSFFKDSDEDYVENIPVYSIFITPDDDIFKSCYESAKNENANTIWLKWVNHIECEISIEAVLRELVKHEQKAEIEPIDQNTLFIIKSFVDYLATEFSKREQRKLNISVEGFKVVIQAETKVENKNYTIKKFENKMIRVFDTDDEFLDIKVKPFLRKVNEEYNLGIEEERKNTQILGEEIIIALNKKKGT